MKLFPKSLLLASLLLAAAPLPFTHAIAADSTADASPSASASDSPSATPVLKKGSKFPFHGKLQAVDAIAMTITVSGKTPRVYILTPDTKIKKNGKSATLNDAVVGDDVGGYVLKGADGKYTALSVRFGPRPGGKKEKAAASASPAATASPQ